MVGAQGWISCRYPKATKVASVNCKLEAASADDTHIASWVASLTVTKERGIGRCHPDRIVACVSTLDHLVIAAADLEEGARWIEERIGVSLDAGGRHDTFGTHNRLLSLGPDSYLEVIAVDPDAPPPGRPKWFELDTSAMRERLAAGPALIHWVVRVGSVDEIADPLELVAGTTAGSSECHETGVRRLAGSPRHTSSGALRLRRPSLPDKGIRLESLVVATREPELVRNLVRDVGGPVSVTAGSDVLSATLTTPHGHAVLASPAVEA